MPIKNAYSRLPADNYIQAIIKTLAKHGAVGILQEFEQGTGFLNGLSFKIELDSQPLSFRLPLRWRAVKAVLIKQNINGMVGKESDAKAYRIAWAILKDWVEAQMALLEVEAVQLQEVFLPYAITRSGETLYEKMQKNPGLLLGSGE